MRFLKIKESELKEITLFLIETKVIIHPKISPLGVPDFTNHHGKEYILLLDRNLLVILLRLVKTGEVKDKRSLKIISSILLWSELNNVRLNSGLALTEYSDHHQGNVESSLENNIFLAIQNQYKPEFWLELAIGERNKIPKIKLGNQTTQYSFFVESDHFKMHYLEMLKLAQLYFQPEITISEKFRIFHQWVYDNILICKYTTIFAVLLFGNKSKVFSKTKLDIKLINNRCVNQAWDLTYLSFGVHNTILKTHQIEYICLQQWIKNSKSYFL